MTNNISMVIYIGLVWLVCLTALVIASRMWETAATALLTTLTNKVKKLEGKDD